MSGSYPGLGFDPTPGEPGAVQAVLDTFATAGENIASILPQLQSAVSTADGWDGDAAEEFSDYGDDIPNGLAEGAESMGQAADALVVWYAA
ncbi:MAG: WXG100 family type VII secretion target, partial [Pseudonocardiaceae bacterium]